jgi:hypothetical protein
MQADEYGAASSISSAAWSSKNQSVVDAQRLKIEAMMSKCSSDESKHVIDESDRKCWWLEDDNCEGFKQKCLNDSASRTAAAQKNVTFSSSLEQEL